MRQAKGIALVAALQLLFTAANVWAETARVTWLGDVCWLGLFAVPFAGYIAVLYRAPMRFASSPPARIAVLTLLSFVLTMFGALFSYTVLAIAGMPVRG